MTSRAALAGHAQLYGTRLVAGPVEIRQAVDHPVVRVPGRSQWYLRKGDCYEMVSTREDTGRRDDASLCGGAERFHADRQETIACLPLDDLVRMNLLCQSFSQEAQK